MREGPRRAIPNWVALLLANHTPRTGSDYSAAKRANNLANGRKLHQRKQREMQLQALAKCLG